LSYHFEPGSPKDGVTATIPVFLLNQVDQAQSEWLVPGMLKEKVLHLLKSLPQNLRRHCVPLPDYAQGFFERWFATAADPDRSLLVALADDIRDELTIRVAPADFKPDTLPAHLFMNFRVVVEHGRMLSAGRNLSELKAEHAPAAQA